MMRSKLFALLSWLIRWKWKASIGISKQLKTIYKIVLLQGYNIVRESWNMKVALKYGDEVMWEWYKFELIDFIIFFNLHQLRKMLIFYSPNNVKLYIEWNKEEKSNLSLK